jgi:subtilase family serine protease
MSVQSFAILQNDVSSNSVNITNDKLSTGLSKSELKNLKNLNDSNELKNHARTNISAFTTVTQSVRIPYYPMHVQGAYNLSGKNTGAKQIIAIVDAYGYPSAYSDLYSFCRQFGLLLPNNVTTLSALKSNPPPNKFNFMVQKMRPVIVNDKGWSLEQALDIQWAHVSAPLASILLVQAATSSFTDLFAGIQYAISAGANVISLSWGTSESKYLNTPTYTNIFNAPNVTFLASSGDSVGVYYPSVLQNVVSVGGSTLTINSTNDGTVTTYSRNTEKVWNNSLSSSEGSGISKYTKIPSYQVGFTSSSAYRCVPDIVSIADPNTGVLVYNSFYTGKAAWYQIGGTSLASPFMAGIVASANTVRINQHKSAFNTNTLLTAFYKLLGVGNLSNYSKSIYDVTTGSVNGNTTKTGYDVPSGVGAPIGDALIEYLTLV